MKTKILFWSLFNRWLPRAEKYKRMGMVHPALTPRWIKQRFAIWRSTAYKSIVNQDYDCSYAVGCSMLAKNITGPLFSKMPGAEALHSSVETRAWLGKVLEGYERVIVVRLDSDDMYAPCVAREVHEAADRADYFYWQSGYGFSINGLRLYEYNTKGVGPFFAHRYSAEQLIERGTMVESRHHLIHKKQPLRLQGGRFMVTVHGANLSTRVNARRFISELIGVKRVIILRRFKMLPGAKRARRTNKH